MKRKIQMLLFMLTIVFIIITIIFVALDVNKKNISLENNAKIMTEEDNISIEIEENNSSIVMEENNIDSTMKISAMSNIALPAGSTSDDLQVAVNNATSGDVIIISENLMYTTTTPNVTIPANKEITIGSDSGKNWILSQSKASIRHFTVNGTLNLQDITLDGSSKSGGVTVNNGGTLNMNDGTVMQNCYNYDGGAVMNSGTFNMHGGTITQCSGGNAGGVRCAANGQFNMYGGTIADNSSIIAGGVIVSYLRCI